MGTKLSIDKTVSELEDIMALPPSYFKKIKFENKSPQGIAHHLKLWKFIETSPGTEGPVRSEAISLQQIKTTGFTFRADEAYLVLLIYRKNSGGGDVLDSLPNSTWTLIESHSNLTPRGLEVPVAGSEPMREVNRVEVM